VSIIKYINILFNTKQSEVPNKGHEGEQIACKFLKKHGYKVIEKNYTCKYGEMDIIAVEKNVLCFIEVKSRRSIEYGLPEEYVDKRKQEKLIKTAHVYSIAKKPNIPDRRFDVVSVDLNNLSCRVIKNAFEVNL